MNLLQARNSLLGMEFDRYLREHPEFTGKIPENARVILLLERNDEFNKWSMCIGKEQENSFQYL